MIPDISQGLSWLQTKPDVLKDITRGIERETLRIKHNGVISNNNHPELFGSALKHSWITTDFAESLLEFITPVNDNIEYMFAFLRDIHRYVAVSLQNKELMWPFSMPCIIQDVNKIKIAQYGKSNLGRMKTLYRQGLKNRYGSMMQLISGVHYNFSLSTSFWKDWAHLMQLDTSQKTISTGYLILIRNYYRFGWVIPYLFGASPAVCNSFLDNIKTKLPFKTNDNNTFWLPYATSLRLSNLGYQNKCQDLLKITFNSLENYVKALKTAIQTPCKAFKIIGMKDFYGNQLQINTNILQNENEFYSPIRPKCTTVYGENVSDALLRSGIQYIEIRSLDVNPFSAIGLEKKQVYFLDLFLIWCLLLDSSEMTDEEIKSANRNWNVIVLKGRKPNQKIMIDYNHTKYLVTEVGKKIFSDLSKLAKILDNHHGGENYQQICKHLVLYFDNPELTYSARMLNIIKNNGIINTGLKLAKTYHNILCKESLEILTKTDFIYQAQKSLFEQKRIENND
ncbi:MAG: glutamate--cysteine ligase [Pantoea sp. Brub]|nr:glutamate--cysteine ligase [Pantoea sp. Brub]